MMEEQGNNELDASDDNDTFPMSVNKEGNRSVVSQNKRKRGLSDKDRIVTALEKLFEVSEKMMQLVTNAFLKGNEDRYDIAKEVKEIGFSAMDQIKALKIILDKLQTVSLFKSLDADIKKAFVEQLLNENA
ncbi:hypothetical protein L3X38_036561 [Prunus dulcis]|uniref:Uncharacterized protein n=1 Tax=Prunus dulcis TaxID=3755 RepID=A0AAD4YPV4_PRUDU|nr:hypothetical protein L3X38_036561 [Prunus dulcis]